jgi:hypothetical protein
MHNRSWLQLKGLNGNILTGPGVTTTSTTDITSKIYQIMVVAPNGSPCRPRKNPARDYTPAMCAHVPRCSHHLNTTMCDWTADRQ